MIDALLSLVKLLTVIDGIVLVFPLTLFALANRDDMLDSPWTMAFLKIGIVLSIIHLILLLTQLALEKL